MRILGSFGYDGFFEGAMQRSGRSGSDVDFMCVVAVKRSTEL